MRPDSLLCVAGHRGLVGSALVRRLRAEGCDRLVMRAHDELDLEDQASVRAFFETERPEYVFLAAAKVGGILASSRHPGDYIRSNLMVQGNVIEAAYRTGVQKLQFLGSSCVYPRMAPQPIKEEHLLTGPLEPTNEPYAVAKIAGITMCQACNRQYGTNFISVMLTNLYGPGDNFDPERSPTVAVAQHRLDASAIDGGGDDQHVADPRQHQRAQRVVDHRLVVDRQHLLADRQCGRIEARTGPPGQDDAFAIRAQCPRPFDRGGHGASPAASPSRSPWSRPHALPPGAVGEVPRHRLAETRLERVPWPPAQLRPQLRRVDGVAQVVPRPVGHEGDEPLPAES